MCIHISIHTYMYTYVYVHVYIYIYIYPCPLAIIHAGPILPAVLFCVFGSARACGVAVKDREFTKGGLVKGGLANDAFPSCNCNTLGCVSPVQL